MDEIRFRIEGVPAATATPREKPWRASIEEQARRPSLGGAERGVRLRFTLPVLAANVVPPVLDDLAEPVLAVLSNRVGWFGGKRAGVAWFVATKETASPSGCGVAVSPLAEPEASWSSIHDAVFPGPLPKGASDPVLSSWAAAHAPLARSSPPRLALRLDFADASVNVADLAGGRVKAVIDGLHPWFGGDARAPGDHRIDRLVVTKGLPGLPAGAVRILLDRA